MIKIIVTGSDGFIGKRLINKLSENKKYSILGVNSDYLKLDDWTTELNNILCDFNPNVIFHVGACANTLETDSNYMFIRNYESTRIISEWTWLNNSILIYSSSASVYGINNKYPSNLYGWSKKSGEDVAISFGGIGLRYFNVYGPGEEHKGKMASVAYQMFQNNKNGHDIFLFPGVPTRDFVYVDDVVDANINAFENFSDLYESTTRYYEVGSGESRSFEDVLTLFDIPFSYTNEDTIPIGYQFYTKSDKNKWLPNWTPNYNLDIGVTEYKNYLLKK